MKENSNNTVIAFEDMLKVKCNIDMNEEIEDTDTPFTVVINDKETCSDGVNIIDVYMVKQRFDAGFAIYINGNIEYFIVIYEPHGAMIDTGLNAIIVYGHEQIITLNLDNGVFNEVYTR